MRHGIRLRPSSLAALLLLAANTMTLADTPSKETNTWWSHIRALASDEFQGRLTGSSGYQQAASYVADRFREYGLIPAGDNGYFQSVGYVVQTVLPERSSVSLVGARGSEHLSVGDDLVLSANTEQRASADAPLIFAGYGIHLPEAGYDDYQDLPVKGAIVVVLIGGPEAVDGAQRAYAYAESLPHYLVAQGAVGVISISNPKDREVPWSRPRLLPCSPACCSRRRRYAAISSRSLRPLSMKRWPTNYSGAQVTHSAN